MVCDVDGFAIYWVLDDEAIECEACDPDAGEPEDWPDWTDQDCWTHIDPPDQVEPSEADCQWAAQNFELPPIAGGAPEAFEPSDKDWDDLHAQTYGIDDSDIAANGLAVG